MYHILRYAVFIYVIVGQLIEGPIVVVVNGGVLATDRHKNLSVVVGLIHPEGESTPPPHQQIRNVLTQWRKFIRDQLLLIQDPQEVVLSLIE